MSLTEVSIIRDTGATSSKRLIHNAEKMIELIDTVKNDLNWVILKVNYIFGRTFVKTNQD